MIRLGTSGWQYKDWAAPPSLRADLGVLDETLKLLAGVRVAMAVQARRRGLAVTSAPAGR